jgi:hypothetical protein
MCCIIVTACTKAFEKIIDLICVCRRNCRQQTSERYVQTKLICVFSPLPYLYFAYAGLYNLTLGQLKA